MESVSIIIPVLNEAAVVAQAIQRAWATEPLEVIVVDGGSDDATYDIAESERCHLLRSPQGRGVQQNMGARQAQGSVLLFLHADTWLAPDGIRQMQHACTNPSVRVGCFRQRIEADGVAYRLLERGNAWRASRLGMPYGDQGLFFRRSFLDELGGFPDTPFMEDWLLMRRARRRARPRLLPGPLHVSPRRWQRNGILRQTLRNWLLITATTLGASPDRLARFYRHHR
ncbi:MAG: TIGR04283 family arsenosugar biosynthesis glycosyltransferase [Pirellulales bacterium]